MLEGSGEGEGQGWGDGGPQAALPGQDCRARAWRDWLQGQESRMPGAAEASKEGVLPRGDSG